MIHIPCAHHVLSQFRHAVEMWEGEMGQYKIDKALENLSVYRADQETEHPRGPPAFTGKTSLHLSASGSTAGL